MSCKPGTIKKWFKQGLFKEKESESHDPHSNPLESDSHSILKALEWLKENNKRRYVRILESYLNEPYKCEGCVYCLNKPRHEANNATIKYVSENLLTSKYVCNDCHTQKL